MHNVVPRLSETPGHIRWTGGALGQDNQRVYHDLGVSCDELERLSADGVI
jgi:formyl-CoA transferase